MASADQCCIPAVPIPRSIFRSRVIHETITKAEVLSRTRAEGSIDLLRCVDPGRQPTRETKTTSPTHFDAAIKNM